MRFCYLGQSLIGGFGLLALFLSAVIFAPTSNVSARDLYQFPGDAMSQVYEAQGESSNVSVVSVDALSPSSVNNINSVNIGGITGYVRVPPTTNTTDLVPDVSGPGGHQITNAQIISSLDAIIDQGCFFKDCGTQGPLPGTDEPYDTSLINPGTLQAIITDRLEEDAHEALLLPPGGVCELDLEGLPTQACGCDGMHAADINDDGVVNVYDLLAILSSWGPYNCSNPDSNPAYINCPDINGDGQVNVIDLLILLAMWGPQPADAPVTRKCIFNKQDLQNILGSPLDLSDPEKAIAEYVQVANSINLQGGYDPLLGAPILGANRVYNGLGREIRNRAAGICSEGEPIGLFKSMEPGSTLTNIKLHNFTLQGRGALGAVTSHVHLLQGQEVRLLNVKVTNAKIRGKDAVGGVVGLKTGAGTLTLQGVRFVPSNLDYIPSARVEELACLGLTEQTYLGGLVGEHRAGGLNIQDSMVAARIISHSTAWSTAAAAGGLVGKLASPTTPGITSLYIARSFAAGEIKQASEVPMIAGGLIGKGDGPWTYLGIENSYSAMSIEAMTAGGLLGVTDGFSNIDNAFAAASFNQESGEGTHGGLVADGNGNNQVTNSYWDDNVADVGYSDGGEDRTTSQMQASNIDPQTYIGWDFDQTWYFATAESNSYPVLTTIDICSQLKLASNYSIDCN